MLSNGIILKTLTLEVSERKLTMRGTNHAGVLAQVWQCEWYGQVLLYYLVRDNCKASLTTRHILIAEV